MYVCTNVCLRVCMYVIMYKSMCFFCCMYVCMYVCIVLMNQEQIALGRCKPNELVMKSGVSDILRSS